MMLSNLMGFIAPGLFYGAISSFVRFMFSSSDSMNPFKIANQIENLILLIFMTFLLISIGMGKHIDEKCIDKLIKGITLVLCLVNMFIFFYALFEFFESALNIFILLIFLLSFVLPPLIFDCQRMCRSWLKYISSMVIYIVSMPLYLIVF